MSVMFLPLRLIPVPIQCVVLSTVLEMFFARDTSLLPQLEALHDKVFRIDVKDHKTTFWLGFTHGKPWIHSSHDGDVDVTIEASTTGFARLCFAKEDPDDLVFQQVLKLSGDSEAMLRFKALLTASNLDWELELRSAFGEAFGTRVAKAAHAMVAAESKLGEASRGVAQGYLQDIELPDGERLQQWQAGVEALSRKLSQLKGRVTRIENIKQDRC
ncbi:MAG: SCP2 sterol-binding domain-containing protein [Mariprofundaceae bacterium]